MKLLDLDLMYRHWLSSRNALTFDCDLNEKLIGLTHSESISFVQMAAKLSPIRSRTLDELERFTELNNRHEFARKSFL